MLGDQSGLGWGSVNRSECEIARGRSKVTNANVLYSYFPLLALSLPSPRLDGIRFLILPHPLQPLLHLSKVREEKLQVDNLGIPQRVHRAVDVNHVFVFEAPYHVNDCVTLTDVGKELVPESLPVAGSLHETRDVYEFKRSWNRLRALVDVREDLQPDGWVELTFEETRVVVGKLQIDATCPPSPLLLT